MYLLIFSSNSGVAGHARVSRGIPELTVESLLRYLRRELCRIVPVAGGYYGGKWWWRSFGFNV